MKKWAQFLLCVLIAAGAWCIRNLAQNYVSIVSVPVIAESNIEGRSRIATTEATITAQVSGSGYNIAALSRKHQKTKEVLFNKEDFNYEGDNLFSIKQGDLYKYSSAIFGNGINVESFISDSPKFVFPQVTYKKVPIQKVLKVSYAPQYMATSPMKIQPDSVAVYGETSKLENINQILTRPLELKDLKASAHGKIKLDNPSGLRLSDEEVVYSIDVQRYVELQKDIKIETRNVPRGVDFSVLPSTATVKYRCTFPVTDDPTESVVFYIDYRDFINSLGGVCIAKPSKLPSGVIEYSLSPETFECIVTNN